MIHPSPSLWLAMAAWPLVVMSADAPGLTRFDKVIETPAMCGCYVSGIPATIDRVIDGDTFDVTAHLPLGVSRKLIVRLANIDTWEPTKLTREKGLAASEFVRDWVRDHPNLALFTQGQDGFGRATHSMGRIIAEVCPIGAGQCLSDALREAGHEDVGK